MKELDGLNEYDLMREEITKKRTIFDMEFEGEEYRNTMIDNGLLNLESRL